MNMYIWIVASIVASFILGAIVSSVITRANMLKEMADKEAKARNNEMWMNYLKTLQGGQQ